MPDTEQSELARLTVELLSAFVANNSVSSDELPGLILSTRSALAAQRAEADPAAIEHNPAVSIEESLASRDHIVSLIDGKPYKTLKRHLSNNGLTPAEYRARYSLPGDYPIVARSYSEQRRAFAKAAGLGGRASGGDAKSVPAKALVAAPTLPAKAAKVSGTKIASKSKASSRTAPKSAAKVAKAPVTVALIPESSKTNGAKSSRGPADQLASKPETKASANADVNKSPKTSPQGCCEAQAHVGAKTRNEDGCKAGCLSGARAWQDVAKISRRGCI